MDDLNRIVVLQTVIVAFTEFTSDWLRGAGKRQLHSAVSLKSSFYDGSPTSIVADFELPHPIPKESPRSGLCRLTPAARFSARKQEIRAFDSVRLGSTFLFPTMLLKQQSNK